MLYTSTASFRERERERHCLFSFTNTHTYIVISYLLSSKEMRRFNSIITNQINRSQWSSKISLLQQFSTKMEPISSKKVSSRAKPSLLLQSAKEKVTPNPSDNVFILREFDGTNNANSIISLPLSMSTANQQQITAYKVNQAVKKFQKHDGDTGSAAVQIAVLTEKMNSLAKHVTVHRQDKSSQRGLQMMASKRKSMLQYLKKSDFESFRTTVSSLGLYKEAVNL